MTIWSQSPLKIHDESKIIPKSIKIYVWSLWNHKGFEQNWIATVIKVTFFWNYLIGHYFWRWMENAINIHPIWSKLAWLRAIPTWPNIDPGQTIPNLTQKLLTFRYLSRNLDEPKFLSIRRPTWPDLTKLWTMKDQPNMLAMETRTLESIILVIFLVTSKTFLLEESIGMTLVSTWIGMTLELWN